MSPESQFELQHKLYEEISVTAEAQPIFLCYFTFSLLTPLLYLGLAENDEDN